MHYMADFFRSSDDRLNLRRHRWLPDSKTDSNAAVRGVVVFAHGILEHGARHGNWASRLAEQGIAVTALDHRGHGESEGERVWVDRFELFVDDLMRLTEWSCGEFPDIPVFLMGFSMGGAIVAQSWRLRRPPVDGLILTAPALHTSLFPILRHIAPFVDRLVPRLRLFDLGTARKISRDRSAADAFRADPLVHHGAFPMHIGAETLRASREINRDFAAFDLPILMLHGTGDAITGIVGCERMYAGVPSQDRTLHRYDGGYHDLLHELPPTREQVVADLLAWLEPRLRR